MIDVKNSGAIFLLQALL